VALLASASAEVAAIAKASAEAAESSLERAKTDTSVGHAFWLLTQLPLAARSDDFAASLTSLGVNVRGRAPSLLELASSVAVALETEALSNKTRTDLGAMARQAAVESVFSLVGQDLPKLFEPSGSEVRSALARFGRSDQFSILAREFFSRLTRRSLEYFLSRELSNHVGSRRQFATPREHSDFSSALDLHCRQASRIIDEFASDWFGKRLRDQVPVSRADASAFARIAFKKMRSELKQRRAADA